MMTCEPRTMTRLRAHYLAAYREHVPFNADYLNRAAMAMAYGTQPDRGAIKELLDQAVATDPSSIMNYLNRARLETEMGDAAGVQKDYSLALGLIRSKCRFGWITPMR